MFNKLHSIGESKEWSRPKISIPFDVMKHQLRIWFFLCHCHFTVCMCVILRKSNRICLAVLLPTNALQSISISRLFRLHINLIPIIRNRKYRRERRAMINANRKKKEWAYGFCGEQHNAIFVVVVDWSNNIHFIFCIRLCSNNYSEKGGNNLRDKNSAINWCDNCIRMNR